MYERGEYEPLTKEKYVSLVADAIEFLPENTYEYQTLIDILEKGAQIVNMLKIPI